MALQVSLQVRMRLEHPPQAGSGKPACSDGASAANQVSLSNTFAHSSNHWRITPALVISLKDREL